MFFSQVYGQIESEGDSEHFEFSHSYSAIHQPPDKIEPDGKFFSFEHYNVEVRKRVKCITAIEGLSGFCFFYDTIIVCRYM